MYSINKYIFEEFKSVPGHRANYAILCNPEFKERQWGIKYSPTSDYSREYKVLSCFSHPQIPVRYGVGKDTMYKDDKFVLAQSYLVMTHFEGEDVVEYYKKKGVPDLYEIGNVIKYFSSATLPLQHMHSKGYVHSDIKPGHLILNPDTGTMTLIDLECTIKAGEVIRGMSKEYASPEQRKMIRLLRNLSDNKNEKSVLKEVRIDTASDLYSIGLILYQVLTGRLWQDEPIAPSEINKDISGKLNRVVMGLLEESPDNRIQSAEVLKAELELV